MSFIFIPIFIFNVLGADIETTTSVAFNSITECKEYASAKAREGDWVEKHECRRFKVL